MVDFYVAKINYEQGLNGAGRTLLVRENVYHSAYRWTNGSVNSFANNSLDTWMNGTYKNMFPSFFRTAMGSTTIYYTPGNGNWSVGTLQRSVFPLSLTEFGFSDADANVEGSALPIASTLRIAYEGSGDASNQWTRSPYTGNTTSVWIVNRLGAAGNTTCTGNQGARPCFTLPSDFSFYLDSAGNVYENQEYELFYGTTDAKGNPITIGTQIATGSYVGTGTYGANNPNTLTFEFEPKLVMVVSQNSYSFGKNSGIAWMGQPGASNGKIFTLSGNSLSWYSSEGTSSQLNNDSFTYYYFALG